MMRRRGFLGAILAAAAGPAIVRASSLMPIYVPPKPAIIGVDMAAGLYESYSAFVHPSMYEEIIDWARTGEASLYRGELYSLGVKIIPSALPAASVLAAAPSIFELTRENISRAIRQIERDTARRWMHRQS